MMIPTFYQNLDLGNAQYRKVPEFSDKQVWANSVDPD